MSEQTVQDLDQTAHEGAFWSSSTQFAILSVYFGPTIVSHYSNFRKITALI